MVLKRLLFRTFTTTVNTKKNNTSFCHWCCYRKYTAYYFYRIYPYFHLNKISQFFYYPLWSCTKWEASDMLFGATICCMHKKLLPQSTGFWERNVLNLFSPCTWIYAPLLLFAVVYDRNRSFGRSFGQFRPNQFGRSFGRGRRITESAKKRHFWRILDNFERFFKLFSLLFSPTYILLCK